MPQPIPVPPAATQSVVVQPAPVAAPSFTAGLIVAGEWAGALAAIAAAIAVLYRILTRELTRDVAEVRKSISEVDAKTVKNATRIDTLEQHRTEDIARLVRVETMMEGIEKTTARIEATLDKNFGELATSIREVRNVAPRGAA